MPWASEKAPLSPYFCGSAPTPRAKKRQGALPTSSGLVDSLRHYASCKAIGGVPQERRVAGQTMVMSTASSPFCKGSLFAATSMRRSSNRATAALRSCTRVLQMTRSQLPRKGKHLRPPDCRPEGEATQGQREARTAKPKGLRLVRRESQLWAAQRSSEGGCWKPGLGSGSARTAPGLELGCSASLFKKACKRSALHGTGECPQRGAGL